MKKTKYFSTFSGIGGFELGIENAAKELGLATECVGFSEVDKFTTSVYQRHFPNTKNYGDIKQINTDELPDFDLLVGGFPCQDVSMIGKRKGLAGERTGLFYELARILEAKQPKYFVFENVSAPTKEKTLSKSYKPSITWVTVSNGECLTHNTSEPRNTVRELSSSDFFEKNVDQKYYLSEEKTAKLFSLLSA